MTQVAHTAAFDVVPLGPEELGIVVMVCQDCGCMCTASSAGKHSEWHREQRSGGGDASSTAFPYET